MTENGKPALLDRLKATVDDDKIFDMSGVKDKPAFRAELREAWQALYDNAVDGWLGNLGEPPLGAEFPGPVMCRRFDPLSSCWLESFRDGIRHVGKQAKGADRAFLYFMLGVLASSWQTYLGLRSGEITHAMFDRANDEVPFEELVQPKKK